MFCRLIGYSGIRNFHSVVESETCLGRYEATSQLFLLFSNDLATSWITRKDACGRPRHVLGSCLHPRSPLKGLLTIHFLNDIITFYFQKVTKNVYVMETTIKQRDNAWTKRHNKVDEQSPSDYFVLCSLRLCLCAVPSWYIISYQPAQLMVVLQLWK